MGCGLFDERMDLEFGQVAVSTMPFANGLAFRPVVVLTCDDEIILSAARIEKAGDTARSERRRQHGTPLALCRLHPSAGAPAGDCRQARFGVPGG